MQRCLAGLSSNFGIREQCHERPWSPIHRDSLSFHRVSQPIAGFCSAMYLTSFNAKFKASHQSCWTERINWQLSSIDPKTSKTSKTTSNNNVKWAQGAIELRMIHIFNSLTQQNSDHAVGSVYSYMPELANVYGFDGHCPPTCAHKPYIESNHFFIENIGPVHPKFKGDKTRPTTYRMNLMIPADRFSASQRFLYSSPSRSRLHPVTSLSSSPLAVESSDLGEVETQSDTTEVKCCYLTPLYTFIPKTHCSLYVL